MKVLQKYMADMTMVNVNLNPVDRAELSGLTLWVRKAADESRTLNEELK
jgi:hypothetical protein